MPYIDLSRQATNKGDVNFGGQNGTGFKWEYATAKTTKDMDNSANNGDGYALFTAGENHELSERA